MPVGFIKTVSGKKRMRWVRSGYDADNLTLPQNAVVFDSESPGIYGVYLTGMWSGTITSTPTIIASWPSLGYTPLVTWQPSVTASPNQIQNVRITIGLDRPTVEMSASPTNLRVSSSSTQSGVVLRYIVHRMPA